jgi:adenylate cyclase
VVLPRRSPDCFPLRFEGLPSGRRSGSLRASPRNAATVLNDRKITPLAELQAIGPESHQTWSETLRTETRICLGREPRSGWRVAWDSRISREHAMLYFDGRELRVERLASARNKIYYRDEPQSTFTMVPGEEFRIGKTTFRLVLVDVDHRTAEPFRRSTFLADELVSVAFGNADVQLELLSRLPDVITGCEDDADFALQVARLLLEAIPSAHGVAVVKWGKEMGESPLVMRAETQQDDPHFTFRPSRRLMAEALSRSETIAHTWGEEGDVPNAGAFTLSGDVDWAFCVPISGEACAGWCLYVAGHTGLSVGPPDELKGDMRFVQLVARFVGAIGRVLQLEKQRSGMARFFSPIVFESMNREMRDVSFSHRDRNVTGSQMLVPREGNITVLFCDIRGFSRRTERAEGDLHQMMARVSEALGVMTHGIMQFEGVVADFIGDSALGFWGWPETVDDGPLRACRAALAILREFHDEIQRGNEALADFHVGIGIAHGLAIAGRIGTTTQAKVDVFGPVVNVGSRLEGMTKQFRTQVIVDETTAKFARRRLSPHEGRLRRLAVVRPAGMDNPVTVTELLPAEGTVGCRISDRAIEEYETALDAFTAGDWSGALDTLDALPVEDRVKHFLMVHIAQHGYAPPEGWDGVIRLSQK